MRTSDLPDQQSSLLEWRQGDFTLDVGPFIYGERPNSPDETRITAYLDDVDPPGFVVISQTCDIVSAENRNPWVVVCPLVRVDPVRLNDIERGWVPRFALVENAPEGLVAELVRPLTIGKGLLASWRRTQGFTDPTKAVEFARSIERCFGRFAFPEDFNRSISPLIRKLKQGYGKVNSEMGRVARSLAELRVRPSAPWESDAVCVRFFLIVKPEGQREAGLELISSSLESVLQELPWKGGFQPDDPSLQIGTYDDFLARDYIESVALDINALSFAARYWAGE